MKETIFHSRDGGSVDPSKEFGFPTSSVKESGMIGEDLFNQIQLVVDLTQTLGNLFDPLKSILRLIHKR